MYYLIDLVYNSLSSYADAGTPDAVAADRQQQTPRLEASATKPNVEASGVHALHAALQKAAGTAPESAVAAAAAAVKPAGQARDASSSSTTTSTSNNSSSNDASSSSTSSSREPLTLASIGPAAVQAALQHAAAAAAAAVEVGTGDAAAPPQMKPAAAVDTGSSSSSSSGDGTASSQYVTRATGSTAAADESARNLDPITSSNTADKLRDMLHKKPCRACTTATDMFSAAFKASQLAHGSSSSSGGSSRSAVLHAPHSGAGDDKNNSGSNSSGRGAAAAAAGPAKTTPAAADSAEDSSSSSSSSTAAEQLSEVPGASPPQEQLQKQPFWFCEDEMPYPPDILELGRATWTLLHSMAAYYPDNPTAQQKQQMSQFIDALGQFYPCQECAGHLRKELVQHPPDVSSATAVSDWACRMHNLVNVRLGKPEFDCSKVFERWRDGPSDDEDARSNGY